MSSLLRLTKTSFPTIKIIFMSGVTSLIFCGTILPLYAVTGLWLKKFNDIILGKTSTTLLAALAIYLIYKVIIHFYKIELTKKQFYILLGGLFVFFFGVKYAYSTSYNQNFYSDFRTMWNYALNTYNSGHFIAPTSPQTQRPLASLVPIVLVFGTSHLVFKISNILFILSSGLIVSHLVSKWISMHAAIIVFILIMTVPEVYFASIIPSHDIPGVFYTLLLLLVSTNLAQTIDKQPTTVLFTKIIFLIILCTILDIQRSILSIVIISLAITLIIKAISDRKTIKNTSYIILITLLLPFISAKCAISVMKNHDILVNRENISKMYKYGWSFRHQHSFSNGTFSSGNSFYKNFAAPIEDEKYLNYLKNALRLSDLYYNIGERPANYILRANRLYTLGTQGNFYYGRLTNTSKHENTIVRNANNKINTIYVTLFIFVLLISSIFFILNKKQRNDIEPLVYFPIIFMSILTMGLSLAGENQPRYMFSGWFLWPIIIVSFIDSSLTNTKIVPNNNSLNIPHKSKGFLLLLIVFIIIYSSYKLIFAHSEYRLLDMSTWTQIECNDRIDETTCQKSIVAFPDSLADKQYSTLKLNLPVSPRKGDYVKVTKKFDTIPGEKYIFSTYIMSPYFRKDGKFGFFDVNIYVNDHLKKKLNIANSKKYQFLQIDDIHSTNGNISISFEILSHVDNSSASWKKASLVNYKFSSLRRQ